MTLKIKEDEVLLHFTFQEGNVGLNMSLQNSVMNFARQCVDDNVPGCSQSSSDSPLQGPSQSPYQGTSQNSPQGPSQSSSQD